MNILIVKPSSLGDLVHTLPAVHLLRQSFPEASLSWVVNDSLAGFVALYPGLDEVMPFRRQRWGRVRHWHELIGFFGELRQQHVDVAIDFQGLFRSGLITFASGAPRRIGFQNAREGAGFFYTERVAVPANLRHAIDRNVFLVQSALGLAASAAMPDLVRPHDSAREARRLRRQHQLDSGGPVLAVAPGGRWPSKRWPPTFFAAALDHLHDLIPDLRCWLLGSRDEAPTAEAVQKACERCQPVSLAGQTDLPTLLELLRHSDALLTNDSGPMHLAAALGVPAVACFGATDADLTGPYGEIHTVFRTTCDLTPCFSRDCLQKARLCSDGTPPARVAEALAAKIRWSHERRPPPTTVRLDEE
ncbi:MAG: glycosyltransferase family 9 protein [Lentisphaerae bacterium]|nr:glycosyltransferase family 9 protein [Lentisphaerota bacterium]